MRFNRDLHNMRGKMMINFHIYDFQRQHMLTDQRVFHFSLLIFVLFFYVWHFTSRLCNQLRERFPCCWCWVFFIVPGNHIPIKDFN